MINLSALSYLIVDTDRHNRQILATLLSRVVGSNHITVLENSEDLNGRLQTLSTPPDLILLGTKAESLDEVEMLKVIRQLPISRQSKIVAVTAKVMPQDINDLKAAGFDGLISKPIIRQTFPNLVQRIMDGQAVWYIA